MARGRKRLPDNLHILRGTFRPTRHGARGKVPILPAAVPDPPDWLSEEARANFVKLGEILGAANVLTAADEGLMAAWAILRAEIAESHREGASVPASRIAQFRLVSAELGLSPTSRAKVSAASSGPEPNPFTGF